jgi:uncharacterized protein (TIGR04255 family)
MFKGEVFKDPGVKQAIFQIKYPNIFSIENKMGDFQLNIKKKFPKSKITTSQEFMLTDSRTSGMTENLLETEQWTKKTWTFKSPDQYELKVSTDSLEITSLLHKTYENPAYEDGFRDVIKFVIDNFFEATQISIYNIVGLRYIDECKVFSKDDKTFKKYFRSSYHLSRFDIESIEDADFVVLEKKNDCYLRYVESLKKIENEYKLILNFDGFANDVHHSDFLKITDKLHDLITTEYNKTIK